jgi:type VI secretion system secreted protein VgrG
LIKNLNKTASAVGAEMADLKAQMDLMKETLADFKQAALLASAPAGMALTTAASAHIGAGDNLSLVAGGTQNWTALKNLVGLAGGAVSFFAQKLGIKLIANQGKVDIQAQNDAMTLAAMKDLNISSSAGVVTIAGNRGVLLAAGGGYFKINESGEVESGSRIKFTIKANMGSDDPATFDFVFPNFSKPHSEFFILRDEKTNKPLINHPYRVQLESGEMVEGFTDEKGKTAEIFTAAAEKIAFMGEEPEHEEVQAYLAGETTLTTLKLEIRSKTHNKT